MAEFTLVQKVMFRDCDPARIVFYPKYFEMVNGVIETWFDETLHYSFSSMLADAGNGVPVAVVQTRFLAPSRLGDKLEWVLRVDRLGRTSITLSLDCRCNGEHRVSVDITLVHVDARAGRPAIWPDPVRATIQNFMEGSVATY